MGPLIWVGCTALPRSSSVPPSPIPTSPTGTISGIVLDEHSSPLAGATVRVQATENSTNTAADGSFSLAGIAPDASLTVTAWFEGYFVGWAEEVTPGAEPLTITLKPYYTTDNPEYDWFSLEGAEGSLSCSHCMPCYEEWMADAHSQSAVNPRFLTMYNGTDVNGNQSPLTRYGFSRDYGSFPLLPDTTQPYYGPGYRLDFPETEGNCATCHVPAAAAYPGMAYAADPNKLSGIEVEGVFCEFCHKIGEVILDPATGLPYPNTPGVLSMRLYRPEEEQQLFFGNFDDVTRRVSYLPLIEESAFCAPCHYGVFWDEVIYNSYGEWLESPYSDPATGQTCQDCHMPAVAYDHFVYPEQGGIIRDPNLIFSHQMPGASDETLLQNAVTLEVSAVRREGRVQVTVVITNDKTGHHVPTDSPLRHLILLVRATDGQGEGLDQLAGPTVPEWGGVGDPAQGYYAGLPGTAFAKVLQELWTEVSPTGSYWNPTRIVSDNRIAAFETTSSDYTFSAPTDGEVQVEVTLLFRRAFLQIMDWKDWDVPDIIMAHQSIILKEDN
ncbi:MAG: carboxypeptidase regulatory-like domain-containing protein [Anaerolineales bacterium]